MDGVILCRCWMSGKTSLVLTLDPQIREYLGLIHRDVIGFRAVVIQGKKMILGEKIPMNKIAVLTQLKPGDVPNER